MSTDDNVFKRVDWPAADGWVPSDDDDTHGLPVRARGHGLSESDLELLMLAARALGAIRVETIEGEQWVNLHFADGQVVYSWNPLMHSDDAFNLQATLQVEVGYGRRDTADVTASPSPAIYVTEWKGQDVAAATRRAVTRAAAEIAVAKENKQA